MPGHIHVRDLARGRWRSLLPKLGVSECHLTGKHGPCPICGGKDRFRFDDKECRGTWICSRCRAGDGFDLACSVSNLPFAEVARRVEQLIGHVSAQPPPREADPEARRCALNRLWTSARPIQAHDPVDRYLTSRGLRDRPSCLRYAPDQPYHEGGQGLGHQPCMVAMVTGPDGQSATLHRTFLTDAGRKADVPHPRKLLPGLPFKGGAVRLAAPGPVIGIAEGIETAMAASLMFSVPVWAALSAPNLRAWQWPPGSARILILGDNDENCTGQEAAYALARRVRARGLIADVQIPPEPGEDWNDVLLEGDPPGRIVPEEAAP